MRIALLQMAPAWEEPERNHSVARSLISEAARNNSDIAVLPEMFSTGFSFELQGLERPNESSTHSFLSSVAKEFEVNLIAGFKALSSDSEKGLNIARAYSRKGKVHSTYIKVHPFTYAGEHETFEPGPGPLASELEGVPSSMFICYDLRFPEDFRMVARHAYVIYVLANWPESRSTHWRALLQARAIENQCFVAGVNRTGTDGNGIKYSGGSVIFNPLGEIVVSGGSGEEIIYADIAPADVPRIRALYPFLDDMILP